MNVTEIQEALSEIVRDKERALTAFLHEVALLHKDLKIKTSHIYSNLSDNLGVRSA